ncbi:uncharacterized protein EV154DRAFT_532998 [Mucor mucedo]|uniref:uncharacterized protein n=1 Tax=Mucor mucedo TaxID=29922 RepID=UPI00222072AB|nr:uncharacterized protein EV154DRAFT_532998 [Mucor mucedo]KAI7865891.1 hypothetical protein EV154DRAFT_532998 [Mucor mucedo]
MPPTQFVPNEIFTQIFKLLSRKDVYNCIYVCKGWQPSAFLAFYETINLFSVPVNFNQLSKYGHITKHLILNGRRIARSKDQVLTENEFFLMLSYVPNLRTIDIPPKNTYARTYAKFMDNVKADEYIKNIQRIGSVRHMIGFGVIHRFCKTIRQLDCYGGSPFPVTGPLALRLLEYLPQFTHLTNLKICVGRNIDITLFDVLQCCPNLVELDYGNHQEISTRTMTQVRTTDYKNLKHLQLRLPPNPALYNDFISLIRNVENLTLIGKGNMCRWFHHLGPYVQDLKRFKQLKIGHKFLVDYEDYEVSSELYVIPFYNFLLKLKGESSLQFTAVFRSRRLFYHTFMNICDQDAKFICYVTSNRPPLMVDHQGIIKTLIIEIPLSWWIPVNLLEYAKTLPNLETLRIDSSRIFLESTKTTMYFDKARISQFSLNQLHEYLPSANTFRCGGALEYEKKQNGLLKFTEFIELKTCIIEVDGSLKRNYKFLKLDFGCTHNYYVIKFNNCQNPMYIDHNALGSDSQTAMITFQFSSPLVEVKWETHFNTVIEPVKININIT